MTIIYFMSLFISTMLIGACFALIFINKRLIKILIRMILLNKETSDVAREAIVLAKECEQDKEKFKKIAVYHEQEKISATKMRHAVVKVAEEFLTRKDAEIQNLTRLVHSKKLKIKHK